MIHAIKFKLINPPENLVYDEVFLVNAVVHAHQITLPSHPLPTQVLQVRQNGERYDVVGNPYCYVVSHILQKTFILVEVVP